jgi:hypothetical protein
MRITNVTMEIMNCPTSGLDMTLQIDNYKVCQGMLSCLSYIILMEHSYGL